MLKRIHVSLAGLLLLLLLLPQASALSQTRRRAAGQQRRTSSNAGRQNAGADARAAGASRVAEQIKLLSRFLYLYGRITNGFDVAAEAAQRGERASRTATEQTEQSRAAVRVNLRNVREGLDDLEIRFRTTPELQRYYTSLAGTAALAASAEEQAETNQFDKAGRALIEAVNKLTNVLLEMR